MQNKIYWEILNRPQKEVLPKLSFLHNLEAYLAGGTALALQLGHRTSVGFDFYTPRHFKSETLIKAIKKTVNAGNIAVISLEDIAAMKLIAITQRGKRRDFIDFYYLLKIFTLRQIMKATQKKYPEFDIYHGLRGLLYFKDADDDLEISRIKIFDKKLSWKMVKREIEKKVKEFYKKSL